MNQASVHVVSEISDWQQLHKFLSTNSGYSAYALADLDSPQWEQTKWYFATQSGEFDALVMIYYSLTPPILLLMGENIALKSLLSARIGSDKVFVTAPAGTEDLLEDFYHINQVAPMFRMQVSKETFNHYYG